MRALKGKESEAKDQNVLVINVDDDPEETARPAASKSTKIPVLKAKDLSKSNPECEANKSSEIGPSNFQELSNGYKTNLLPASPSSERQLSYLKLACLVNGYDSFDAKSGEALKEVQEDDLSGDIRLKSSSDMLNSCGRFYDLKKKEPSKDPLVSAAAKKAETESPPETESQLETGPEAQVDSQTQSKVEDSAKVR